MFVYVYEHMRAGPEEVRGKCWIRQSRSYVQLWAAQEVSWERNCSPLKEQQALLNTELLTNPGRYSFNRVWETITERSVPPETM